MAGNLNRIANGHTDPGILRHRITASTDEQFIRWFKQALGQFAGGEATTQTNGSGPEAGGARRMPAADAGGAEGSVAATMEEGQGAAPAAKGGGENIPSLAQLLTPASGTGDELMLAALQIPVRPEGGAASPKTTVTRPSAQAAPERPQFSPRSVRVTPGDEGMNVWIRDYGISASLGRKVLEVFRRAFGETGTRIAKIVLNGKTVWTVEGGETPSSASAADGMDRKY